jgi:hypothetical protein
MGKVYISKGTVEGDNSILTQVKDVSDGGASILLMVP